MKVEDEYEKTPSSTIELSDDDDKELVALGYKPSFKREFSNLATVCSYLFDNAARGSHRDVDKFCFQYHGKLLHFVNEINAQIRTGPLFERSDDV